MKVGGYDLMTNGQPDPMVLIDPGWIVVVVLWKLK